VSRIDRLVDIQYLTNFKELFTQYNDFLIFFRKRKAALMENLWRIGLDITKGK
jgi:hypothetical protein